MQEKRIKIYTTAQRLNIIVQKSSRKANSRDYIAGDSKIEIFRIWIRNCGAAGGAMLDRNKYTIDGEICIAYMRNRQLLLSEFHDSETINIVNLLYELKLIILDTLHLRFVERIHNRQYSGSL